MNLPLTDMFQELWAQVRKERRDKLESLVEQMLSSPRNVGILIHENQFGVILDGDLNDFVPFGEIRFVRRDLELDIESLRRSISTPEGSDRET